MRNKYQPGKQLPKGLQLLKDWPNESIENRDPVDAVQEPDGDILNEEGIDGEKERGVETEGG